MEYRNEFKYICSEGELEVLRARLQVLMRYDAHQRGESYRVRSLYFDDGLDSAFSDNAAGVDDRRKYRVRVYDDLENPIRLEIKDKLHDKTRKSSCPISKRQCIDMMQGRMGLPKEDAPYPLTTFCLASAQALMRPRLIVEYERTAFVHPFGNTRITFDRNIVRSEDIRGFFSEEIVHSGILSPGLHVLEVKYDSFLPDWIAQALELGNLRRTTFSKYYLGRLCEKGEVEL